MPIMTMHDVRKDKTYSAEKWFTLEELAKEAWIDYPKEPNFEATDAVEKKEEASEEYEDGEYEEVEEEGELEEENNEK